MLLSTTSRQKGEAVAASAEMMWKTQYERLEAWQLFNDLQAVLFDWSFALPPQHHHPSTHFSARCSSQNIPDTSGPRVFPKRSLSYHSLP